LLGRSAAYQKGEAKALSLYYRGAILNRLGRYDQAQASLDQALAERDDLILGAVVAGRAAVAQEVAHLRGRVVGVHLVADLGPQVRRFPGCLQVAVLVMGCDCGTMTACILFGLPK